MNTVRRQLSGPVWALLMFGAALGSASVAAADKGAAADASARYRQERAVCTSGQSNQDRVTCLREAEAAFAEARRGQLKDAAVPYERNATQRCERLPDEDRKACAARMQGQGTTRGSAASGGIYRERVTRETVAPTAAEAARPAQDAPPQ